jgi:uncharacterized delta-60 repeat protein
LEGHEVMSRQDHSRGEDHIVSTSGAENEVRIEPLESRLLLSGGVELSSPPVAAAEVTAAVATNTVPNRPYGLVSVPLSSTSVGIGFYDASGDETGFVVERATSASGPFSPIQTVPAHAGSFGFISLDDNTAAPATTYYYRVKAVNGSVSTEYEGPVSVTTPPDNSGGTIGLGTGTVPNGPYGLTAAAASEHAVQVSFHDNASDETAFVLERAASAGGPFAQVHTIASSPGVGEVVMDTDATVVGGTTYFYRVKAINGPLSSGYAGPASATTPGSPVNPGGPPNGPYGLSVTQGAGTSVNVFFIDNADNETALVIERGASAGGPFATLATLPASPGAGGVVTYTDNAVAQGQTWYYRAYALNGSVASSIAGPIGFTVGSGGGGGTTTNPGGPPNGPYALSAFAFGPAQVQLTFHDNSTNETGFVVERSTTSAAGPFVPMFTLPPSPGANLVSFSDTTTQPATTYYYRVYAVNGPYVSSIAGPLTVTTPGAAPYSTGPISLDKSFNASGEAVDGTTAPAVRAIGGFRADLFTLSINGSGGGTVEHFNGDGSVDTSFGIGGKLDTPAGFTAAAAFATSNGRYLVAGTVPHAGANPARRDAAVQALNTHGVDPSFGPNGFAGGGQSIIDLGADVAIGGMVVGPDQKIYVGGTAGGTDYFVARLTADGVLDDSFGVNGISRMHVDFGAAAGGLVLPGPIALDPADGSVVTVAEGVPLFAGGGARVTFLLGERLLPNGTGTELFRTGGSNDQTYDIRDILVEPDRRIVYAGSVSGPAGTQGLIARVNSNGTADGPFGPPPSSLGPGLGPRGNASLNSILLLGNGGFLVAGSQQGDPFNGGTPNNDRIIMRLNPDGTIDPTAAPNEPDHILRTDLASLDETTNALVMAADGTLTAAGQRNHHLSLLRYKNSA